MRIELSFPFVHVFSVLFSAMLLQTNVVDLTFDAWLVPYHTKIRKGCRNPRMGGGRLTQPEGAFPN